MEPFTTQESTFESWDGTELFFRSWRPSVASNKALVVIHRGHEHSGRIAQLVESLDIRDCWAFSWDNRGHGHSPGERGHAESYDHLVRDLDSFVNFISTRYEIPVSNMVVVANSVGAVTAATWVHDFAPRIRAMILAAPAFRIKLYVPMAIPLLRMLQKFKKNAFVSSYVKAGLLTHDRKQSALYDQDELITKNISVNVLLGLHDTSTRILADAGTIITPTLVLSSGSDWVVKNSAQQRFFRDLGSSRKQMESYPGFFHALFYEKNRDKPISEARKFIRESFAEEIDRKPLLSADKGGPTRTEYDLLRQSPGISKSIGYGVQRFGMKTLGRLSEGIRLGFQVGFDSGKSLDYVYENRPRGMTSLGRFIDRHYLDAIGWRGIRLRRENLERLLHSTFDQVREEGETVRLLDVATGCGRYILNVLKKRTEEGISAELRDYDRRNLDQGRRLAEQIGLNNIRFVEGDAFDPRSIASADPPPNVVVVSGLYELFPENQQVRASLEGIAHVISPGGYLIYTGQPWHPQVEMIARVLINRDQKPWIMRRRSQAEMDELVLHAGFEKLCMETDPWGIFTVSVARRSSTT